MLRDDGSRIEVREEVHGVRLVLYLDRAALQTVITDDVRLVPTAAAASAARSDSGDGPGMSLDAGVVVEVIARADNGLSKVRLVEHINGDLRVTGFVPTAKLGQVFRGDSGPTLADIGDISLPARFQLAATPGGPSFATYAGPRRAVAKQVERTGAFTFVRVGANVTGWIASSQIKQRTEDADDLTPMVGHLMKIACEERGEGIADEGTGRCRPDPKNVVREKTPLLDAIDGRTVGIAVSYFRARPTWHDGGWARFDLTTSFGVAQVWAHLDDAAIANAKHAIEHANDPAPPATDDSPLDPSSATAPPPPPPPPPPPEIIPEAQLEPNRLNGRRDLPPDAQVRAEMAKAGKDRLSGTFKLCVEDTGRVSSVARLKSTTFPSYDDALIHEMRTWAFRPIEVHGKPAKVCTWISVSFQLPAR